MAKYNTAVIALIMIGIIAAMGLFAPKPMGGYHTLYDTAPTGQVNLSIGESLSITLIDKLVDFGTGHVAPNNGSAVIDSAVASAGDNWTSSAPGVDGWPGLTDYMTLENNGNVDANVVIAAGSDAATFIGGSSPAQNYEGAENESGSCTGSLQSSYAALTTGQTNLCSSLAFGDSADALNIFFKLTVPSDATPTQKTNTITFTGTKA
jgi:hypothetical protein